MESRSDTLPLSSGLFDMLPPELMVNHLSRLTDADLKTVASLCRKLNFDCGNTLIWRPRLVDQFNVTPPSTVDHRYLYNKLQQETRVLIRFFVFSTLIKRHEEHDDVPEEIVALGLNPTIENIFKMAQRLRLDYEDIAEIFNYSKNIISTILNKPNGYFTQAVLMQMAIFHGKNISSSFHQFTPLEQNCFDEFFPELVRKSRGQKENCLDDYMRFFPFLILSNAKHFMIMLLMKHPELVKIIFDRRHGISLLHMAIDAEQYDLARLLMGLGADVNMSQTYIATDIVRKETVESPLYLAMKNLVCNADPTKAPEAVKFIHDLLAAGADLFAPYAATGREDTPYHFFLKLQSTHQYDQLLEQIANPIIRKNHARLWENLKRTICETVGEAIISCRMI